MAARTTPGGHRLLPLVVPVLLLLVWHVLSGVVSEFALASPTQTIGELISGLREGWLRTGLLATLEATVVGFLLAAAAGLWLGFLIGLSRFWTRVWEPIVLVVYSIPKVTLFPIFLFLFGLSTEARVAFGMFHGVFPILIFTLVAVRALPPVYVKVGRSLHLSSWRIFGLIIVPASLPHVVAGLRFGFSLTFLGVVIAEMFAAREGSGYALVKAATVIDTPRILAIVVALVVVALAINWAFLAIERQVNRGHGSPVVGAT